MKTFLKLYFKNFFSLTKKLLVLLLSKNNQPSVSIIELDSNFTTKASSEHSIKLKVKNTLFLRFDEKLIPIKSENGVFTFLLPDLKQGKKIELQAIGAFKKSKKISVNVSAQQFSIRNDLRYDRQGKMLAPIRFPKVATVGQPLPQLENLIQSIRMRNIELKNHEIAIRNEEPKVIKTLEIKRSNPQTRIDTSELNQLLNDKYL